MRRTLILSIILMAIMNQPSQASSGFADVTEEDWFAENVRILVEENIIAGYGNGHFGPEDQMQADQFIKTMVVALGYQMENGKDYWAEPYINMAVELGIIDDNSMISYDVPITRSEMAMICSKVVAKREGTISFIYEEQIREAINDIKDINVEHLDAVLNMYEIGIITGYPDNTFKPNNTLKRSEACTVIRRVIDEEEREEFVESNLVIEEYDAENKVKFVIMINTLKPLDEQYSEAEFFLRDKIGVELMKDIMSYVKNKKDWRQELPEDYTGGNPWDFDGSATLTGKFWKWGNSQIKVISGINSPLIDIIGI